MHWQAVGLEFRSNLLPTQLYQEVNPGSISNSSRKKVRETNRMSFQKAFMGGAGGRHQPEHITHGNRGVRRWVRGGAVHRPTPEIKVYNYRECWRKRSKLNRSSLSF